jgi:hypothetical protein
MPAPAVSRVFSVDLGSKWTGWAYFVDGKLLTAGRWELESKVGKESDGVRWLRLHARLDEVLQVSKYRPDLVVYEAVQRHMSGGPKPVPNFLAAHAYGGAQAVLLSWCAANSLEHMGVHISGVKAAATGLGGGKGTDKEAVLAAARRRWPSLAWPDGGFDKADAAFIGLAALIGFGIIPATPAPPKPPKESKITKQPKRQTKIPGFA